MKISLIFILLCALLFGYALAQQQRTPEEEEELTKQMVAHLINFYGEENIKAKIPCVVNTNCEDCASNGGTGCVWITRGSNPTDVSLTITNENNTEIYKAQDLKFCWSGNPFGSTGTVVSEFRDKNETQTTTITVKNGWNDFSYQICFMRSGAFNILVGIVIVGVPLACLLLICCCCCYCRASRSRKDSDYRIYDPNDMMGKSKKSWWPFKKKKDFSSL